MPIQMFHCALCGHGYDDISLAVKCEQKYHTSILKPINNDLQSSIVKAKEKYVDQGTYPSNIIVTLTGGEILDYKLIFQGKELK